MGFFVKSPSCVLFYPCRILTDAYFAPLCARPKPVILMIIDGFGIAPTAEGNAVGPAKMLCFPAISYLPIRPMTVLASAESVGLSWGEMGNLRGRSQRSGQGRIFYQSLSAHFAYQSKTGALSRTGVARRDRAREEIKKARCISCGLDSPRGAVHAADEHLFALLNCAGAKKWKMFAVHAFLDGRLRFLQQRN